MGCQTPPTITKTVCPDGSQCVDIDCVSVGYTHGDCLVAFGNACPSGYEIVEDKDGSYLIKCHDKNWK